MRISDWSSDVCSSDLPRTHSGRAGQTGGPPLPTIRTHSEITRIDHPETRPVDQGSGPSYTTLLDSTRLRSTWLVRHLDQGTPPRTLLPAAGLPTTPASTHARREGKEGGRPCRS